MRIALVQTRPARGDLATNLVRHATLAQRSCELGADLVVFPELSITGYEPELAGEMAIDADDPRFDRLQRLADARGATIALGAPIRTRALPLIGLVLLAPRRPRRVHAKHHLHADEEPYFARGAEPIGLLESTTRIAFAICYELSAPEHAAASFAAGAGSYVASVAKTADGVARAHARLAEIARAFSSPALMANCVGPSGDGECAGGSAAWDRAGRLLARLGDRGEGLLLFDAEACSAEVCEL